jgi:hypothetical protein
MRQINRYIEHGYPNPRFSYEAVQLLCISGARMQSAIAFPTSVTDTGLTRTMLLPVSQCRKRHLIKLLVRMHHESLAFALGEGRASSVRVAALPG